VALIVLDTSIVIALLDPKDTIHAAALGASIAHAGEDLRVPASALAETLVVPARAGRMEEVRGKIQLLDLGVIPIGEDIAVEAARLRGRHRSLRLPDALVIASGDLLDADAILTGDRKWTAVSHRVQVVA
jgi:predicted nucleic acid-binding protein